MFWLLMDIPQDCRIRYATLKESVIYRYLFHPVLLRHFIWQQLRMDHGTEFALVSTVQHLAHMRVSSDRHPVLRSLSRHNHRAERLWPEVNARINYPVI